MGRAEQRRARLVIHAGVVKTCWSANVISFCLEVAQFQVASEIVVEREAAARKQVCTPKFWLNLVPLGTVIQTDVGFDGLTCCVQTIQLGQFRAGCEVGTHKQVVFGNADRPVRGARLIIRTAGCAEKSAATGRCARAPIKISERFQVFGAEVAWSVGIFNRILGRDFHRKIDVVFVRSEIAESIATGHSTCRSIVVV